MTWQRTVAVARRGMEAGWHEGFQLAAWVGGEWHGCCLGEAQPGLPMDEGVICPWLSAGKPLTALLTARAVGQGWMGWDDRVASWIPGFARGGKEAVTLRHLLTHTGGMRAADGIEGFLGWDAAVERACAVPLEDDWVPGVTAGYHARGSWLVLAEVACRAWGLGFQALVSREVTGPLGVPGLRFDWSRGDAAVQGRGWSLPGGPGLAEVMGRVEPGAGLRGSAREMAALYARLLSPPADWLSGELMGQLTGRQRMGAFDLTFGAVVDLGLGFVLNTPGEGGSTMPYGYGPHAGPRAFGHSGRQSSCAFADPDAGLAVAWFFRGMPGERVHQRRQHEVNAAVYEDLGLA